ncbi:P-loop containing nucleoside triphosphate hydrolase protein [Polychytrium aggregatum]|uniref:P-loop containing nucleoside triphosphate hydrolase protein n=1 Tax=Polychytrium aggregatum TaxID=110093 RepID=UPI0022FF1909|nr:P-loop containing nucleoside triphosphate hydrolase protein [Polychytrium aggregatum]KAI9197430.1 P-loop containing nucleoside triphosphate hydrolase protein [Polychytrium aggregatum]
MADDGLMMNFVSAPAPTGSGASSASIKKIADQKKGSWSKRRAAAKKTIRRMTKQHLGATNATSSEHDSGIASRPDHPAAPAPSATAKGPRTKSASQRTSAPPSKPAAAGEHDEPSASASAKKRNVVSSLFTSNPDIPSLPAPEPAPKRQADLFAPTSGFQVNASAKTFAALNLNPLLCGHVFARMDVKVPTAIQRAALPVLMDSNEHDVVVQAQTGSGKTLTYLLPLIHRMIKAEQEEASGARLNRQIGCLAMVLAPTRELAKQIYGVLDSLLKYSASTLSYAAGESPENAADASATPKSAFYRHWIVPGLVIGGDKKKSEKACLRKGVNILISTPGRLLDHLKTTKSLQVGNLRWFVLDEADRLMELGFEDTLKEILSLIDRQRLEAVKNKKRLRIDIWPSKRQVVLCSATIREGIKKLAEQSLENPLFVSETGIATAAKIKRVFEEIESGTVSFMDEDGEDDLPGTAAAAAREAQTMEPKKKKAKPSVDVEEEGNDLTASVPKQLQQRYIVTPAKLRLVALISQLRQLAQSQDVFKIIVFISCTDSTDFHHHIISNGHKAPARHEDDDADENSDEEALREFIGRKNKRGPRGSTQAPEPDPEMAPLAPGTLQTGSQTPLVPDTLLFKLHGNLPQPARSAAYKGFCDAKRAILFCTDVAARGLDLPDVTAIVQYDPPADIKDYVHRIGRTARIGREGEAILFLLPSEIEYLDILKSHELLLTEVRVIDSLRCLLTLGSLFDKEYPKTKGKGDGAPEPYEIAATDVQMMIERFILANRQSAELARLAFRSHVRAYCTHVSSERHIFHIKKLHLGHIAKCFGLRETPTDPMGNAQTKKKAAEAQQAKNFKDYKDGKKVKGSKAIGAGAMKQKAFAAVQSSVSEFGDGDVKSLVGGLTKRKRR